MKPTDTPDAPTPDDAPFAPPRTGRLSSIDAYRGLVMFLMIAEVLRLRKVAAAFPESRVWQLLGYHQEHVEWVGCSLHDMIQPSFSFLVGVALPFSLASRRRRGQSTALMAAHALWRAAVLVLLGVFLRSTGKAQTNFTFEDTLSQIGLGYFFLFLIALWRVRYQWLALAVILAGYWAGFALYPLPGPDFNPAAVGVSPEWNMQHGLSGFAAHWNKNANPAWAFDHWFLNLFPRKEPFAYNGGGYATLSFIPTLGTMILGLLAGELLRSGRRWWAKVGWLCLAGVAGIAAGYGLGVLGLCPVVKRIWTPSWVLYSGGISALILAAWYLLLDVPGYKGWALPLIVIGANSIAAYVMSWLIKPFIAQSLKTHVGRDIFLARGETYAPLLEGGAVVLVLWLILAWLYWRKIFIRI